MADDHGRVVAFGIVLARQGDAFLAFLFVTPAWQGRGLGRAVLAECRRGAGDVRRLSTCAEADQLVSTGLYASLGLAPREPIYLLRGELIEQDLPGLPDGWRGRPLLIDDVAELDRDVLGYERPQDHAFWAATERRGWLFESETGRLIGYGYAQASGRIGPVAAAAPESLPYLLGHLVRSVPVLEGRQALVPGSASAALVSLLGAGLRLDGTPAVYCAERTGPRLDSLPAHELRTSLSSRPNGVTTMTTLVPPDPASELGAALEVALAACDEADAISLASFRQAIEISAKPDATFVTAADTAVEAAVRGRISARFPDHGLVGEEYGERPSASGRRWIIDPIDGTHNYMRGVPIFATLLALEVDGDPVLGVVSAPALARRWFAWRGGGAWAASTGEHGWDRASAVPIAVSGVTRLEHASLVYSSIADLRDSGLVPGVLDTLGGAWRDRGLGDFYGYMLVAEGAAEAMLEADLKIWDLAGPRAVLEEAGGRLSDLSGGADMPARGVLASNGHVHEMLLTSLRGR